MESDLLKQSGKIMTREQVMAALEAVNEVLKAKNRTATVLITGGAAIMFLFPEFPRGVKDLDAGFMSPELLSAVEQVTWEQDLQGGWFNDTSKDYYSPKADQTVPGPQFSNLKIELPSKDYLLCLKIMSGRPEEKANDVSDVAFMVSHMPEVRSDRDWQENYYKWFGKKDWKPYTAEAARQAIEQKHKTASLIPRGMGRGYKGYVGPAGPMPTNFENFMDEVEEFTNKGRLEHFREKWAPLWPNMMTHLKSLKFPLILYRQVRIKPSHPQYNKGVGVFWTWDKAKATAYWADSVTEFDSSKETEWVTLTTKVNKDSVDWMGTILAYLMFGGGKEKEIRLLENTPLTLTEIEMNGESESTSIKVRASMEDSEDDEIGSGEHALTTHGKFWGSAGAGCVFVAKDTKKILLAYRSAYVNEPHTWNVWGGATQEGEDPKEAALREAREETGYAGPIELELLNVYQKGDFRYTTYLAKVDSEFTPQLDWENENYGWFAPGEWPKPLHFGLKPLLDSNSLLWRHISVDPHTLQAIQSSDNVYVKTGTPLMDKGVSKQKWYHGCKADRVDAIIKNGIQPNQVPANEGVSGYVYISTDLNEAGRYGDHIFEIDGEDIQPAEIEPEEDRVGDIAIYLLSCKKGGMVEYPRLTEEILKCVPKLPPSISAPIQEMDAQDFDTGEPGDLQSDVFDRLIASISAMELGQALLPLLSMRGREELLKMDSEGERTIAYKGAIYPTKCWSSPPASWSQRLVWQRTKTAAPINNSYILDGKPIRVGDLVAQAQVYRYAQSIHHEEDDWISEDGYIGKNIEQFNSYRLERLPLASINLGEWGVDEDVVSIYTALETPFPPIIYDSERKSIIDGAHRCNAAKLRGDDSILAFVGEDRAEVHWTQRKKQTTKESKMKSKLAGPKSLISIDFTSSDTRVMEALYRKLFSLEDVAPLLEGQTLTATLLKPSDDLADQIILAGEEYGLQPTIHTTKASGLGKKGKAPYKVKEFEGFEILVGRSAIENDTLSFEVANPNDFWLHVDGAPGSHIVIRNPSNLTELPPSVLIEAKRLAIDNSKAKGRNDAMVHWGFAKDLSKPPSSAPGEVYLANWKVAKVKKADLPPPPPAYVQQNVQKPEWVKAPNTPKTIGIVVFEEANVSGDLGFQRKVLTHEAPVRLANDLIDELKEKGLKFNNQQVFKWLMSHIEVREFYTDKTDGTMYCHAEIEKRFFEGLVKTLSAPAK